VLGIGVNVNQVSDDFPPELKNTAVSLRVITGERIARVPLLQKILDNLEKDYLEYCRTGFSSIREYWLQYEAVLGKKVRISMGSREYYGEVTGLAESGELVVRSPQGEEIKFAAGEVTLCREE
jgi:BirA family biotin operon repressor/biotin-[acetyl-CoA-carboxylase] ligase